MHAARERRWPHCGAPRRCSTTSATTCCLPRGVRGRRPAVVGLQPARRAPRGGEGVRDRAGPARSTRSAVRRAGPARHEETRALLGPRARGLADVRALAIRELAAAGRSRRGAIPAVHARSGPLAARRPNPASSRHETRRWRSPERVSDSSTASSADSRLSGGVAVSGVRPREGPWDHEAAGRLRSPPWLGSTSGWGRAVLGGGNDGPAPHLRRARRSPRRRMLSLRGV